MYSGENITSLAEVKMIKEKVKLDQHWNSPPSTLQAIKKTSGPSLVTAFAYLRNTHVNTRPLFCPCMFGVLSVLLEWQNHFMQTGEHSFMQTLDWCQPDWRGMNAEESWGHRTQQHRGAGTSKSAASLFDTEGRIAGQASTLTVHHSVLL